EESPLGRFVKEAREKLRSRNLQGDQDIQASLKGLVRALDPYCAVLHGEQSAKIRSVRYTHGLGLELDETTGAYGPLIKEVALGGPGQKAGLRPGDELVTINGLPAGPEAEKLDELLYGEQAEITVHRPAVRAVIRATLKQEEFLPETSLGV